MSPPPGYAVVKADGTVGSASRSWHFLSVGGNASGLGWHVHGQSWLGVTSGAKRWFTFPPGSLFIGPDRGHPLMTADEWISTGAYELATQRRDKKGKLLMRECPQLPGEVFYLPASWAHQTLNLGESIGVGAQAVFSSLAEANELKRSASSGDPDAQLSLGQIMVQDKASPEAITMLEKADWHPMAIRAGLDLMHVHIDGGELERAHTLVAEIEARLRNASDTLDTSISARAWYQLALALGTTKVGTAKRAHEILTEEVLPRAKYSGRPALFAGCCAVEMGEYYLASEHFRLCVRNPPFQIDPAQVKLIHTTAKTGAIDPESKDVRAYCESAYFSKEGRSRASISQIPASTSA